MYDVHLYIYDLSNGLAAQISQQLTGRFFKAIYHTSVTVHGREYFFGGSGVESSSPAQSPYGTPIEKRLVGQTEVDPAAWHAFLEHCGEDYGVGKYHLLEHNCNTFSDAALQFLLGQRIDPEISSLPSDFLNTPLGQMLRPQIDSMYAPRAGAVLATQHGRPETEVVIDGPTSGAHQDRISEAYQFINTPTLSKLFTKIKSQKDDPELSKIETFTKSLIAGSPSSSPSDLVLVSRYLTNYITSIDPVQSFPGLDLIRILLHHAPFANYLASNPQLLDVVCAGTFDETPESANSRVVFLKMICNTSIHVDLRNPLVSALRKHDKLDFVSGTPLSEDPKVRELGLKSIWNLLILVDGVDDDFKVACLASVAEGRKSAQEQSEEVGQISDKVIKEIVNGGSEAIQEMVEILELEV